MKALTRLLMFAACSSILLFSCQREEISPDKSPQEVNGKNEISSNFDDQIVLGKQQPIAFALENVEAAYQKLYPGTRKEKLKPTHLYIRFLPKTDEEATLIMKDDLELFGYPLDYDVEQWGEYYHDPSIPEGQPTWMYTVVEATYKLPKGIETEIIEELHFPDESDMEEQGRYDITNLTATALQQAGYKEDAAYVRKSQSARRYDPRGTILIQDRITTTTGDITYRALPVWGVKIRAARHLKVKTTYTNENGFFNMDHGNFSNKVDINLVFENGECRIFNTDETKLGRYFATRKHLGQYQRGGMESIQYTIGGPGQPHDNGVVWGLTITALRDFISQGLANGTYRPPKLNIYVDDENDNVSSGAAPMAAYFATPKNIVESLIINVALTPIGGLVSGLAQSLAPDMIINFNPNNFRTNEIMETIYHEIGHTSHFSQNGRGFTMNVYNAYLDVQLKNRPSPYGNGTESRAGLMALTEAWGEYIGAELAHRRYGSITAIHQNDIEAYNPNSGRVFAWIPEGVMHDLQDNVNAVDRQPLINVTDNTNGFTTSQFANALDSDVNTIGKFEARLLQETGNRQRTQVNQLFNSYGY
uniref:Uncharacterized protein n=1 Tax=Roseihalotalea indica TaxID=2867963 RepID=A0AA49GI92_9BACT|nr:hypothetical protein K4G66_18695 [Tunicatimonas sp. TK19036]